MIYFKRNNFEKDYKKLIKVTLNGTQKNTRSGVDALMYPGGMLRHDMSSGFPLVTIKKSKFNLIATELEFFIKGLTDKKWLQDRGNHFYDQWCNPKIVEYGRSKNIKRQMLQERDLGPINGFQWRHFGAPYKGCGFNYASSGIDQLALLIENIKKNPQSKRLVVTAWNPLDMDQACIPPCPFAFEISIFNDKLNLFFYQRSVDLMLGLPADFAEHALLLHLIAKSTGYKEGSITGFFGNLEIYVNHVDGAKKILKRKSFNLPYIKTDNFKTIFDWEASMSRVINYKHHPYVKFDIAI